MLGYLRSQRVAEPEDALGEVFLQVARDLPRFKGDDAALRRWVFSIAHNRAMDAHRREERERKRVDGAAAVVPEPAFDPAEGADPGLLAALGKLSPDQRDVVVLRFLADLSLEAVARITGRRVGAVKALQHRALENLRQHLSES